MNNDKSIMYTVGIIVTCVLVLVLGGLIFVIGIGSIGTGLLSVTGSEEEPHMTNVIAFVKYYRNIANAEYIDPIDLMIYDTLRTENFSTKDKLTEKSIIKTMEVFVWYEFYTTSCSNSGDDCTEEIRKTRTLFEALDIIQIPPELRTNIPDLRSYYEALIVAVLNDDDAGNEIGSGAGSANGYIPPSSWRPVIKEFIWPSPGYLVSSGFGWRNDPLSGSRSLHAGIDIAVPRGTDVYSTKDGIVMDSYYSESGGNIVEIQHDRFFSTRYLHLDTRLVQKGDVVKKGQIIAKSGNTGTWTSGAHLHYEIKLNGITVAPLDYYQ